MNFIITESQFKLLNELDLDLLSTPDNIESKKNKAFCNVFSDPNQIKKCHQISDILRSNIGQLASSKSLIDKKIKNFGEKNNSKEIYYDNIKKYIELYDQKKKHLEEFIEIIPPGCNTLKIKAEIELKKLTDIGGNILMYRDKEQSKYSYFNRLNTNYSALAILYTQYAIEKNIVDNEPQKIMDSFKNDEKHSQLLINQILLGQLTKITEGIILTISITKRLGQKAEDDYKKYLDSKNIEYKDFSDDFGTVDFMGIDLMVKSKKYGYYVPIQVKSYFTNFDRLPISKYCDSNCITYLVYPDKKGGWVYNTCQSWQD